MNHISARDVMRQLHADLIGKDSYRGVTLTYSWLANQFGHISLGFIPTLIVYFLFLKNSTMQDPEFYSALIVSVTWLLFETYNFLGPLLMKQIQKSSVLAKGVQYTFKPVWGNIAFDTITDLCFFWLGAFSASALLLSFWLTPYILIGLLLLLIYPVKYWFLTKMYLQIPQYPYQFRLSQWDYAINDDNKKTVYDFIANEKTGRHLFVFGSRNSGKTGICVGMGTEMSIKHNTCIYTTAMKLYNLFEPDQKQVADPAILWTWRNASLLIIDDINPCYPSAMKQELVTPKMFLQFLDDFSPADNENRKIIKDKNVIWVLGGECSDDLHNQWKEMLLEIGVDKGDIVSIDLG